MVMAPEARRSLFWRSFLLQACWNFERMQNLGFAFCLDPWFHRLDLEAHARRPALARHLDFFNTQPYMAGLVLGVVARMEEDLVERPQTGTRAEGEARIAKTKAAFGAALAGIGDALFWGTLRPVCAALAILCWLVLWSLEAAHPVGWAVAAYLAAYNVPALSARWRGPGLGYQWGERAAVELKRFKWQERIRRMRWAGLAMAGALTVSALLVPPWTMTVGWANVGVLAAAVAARSLGLPTPRIYTMSIGVALAAAWAGA